MYYLSALLILIGTPFLSSPTPNKLAWPGELPFFKSDSTITSTLKHEEIVRLQFEDSLLHLYSKLHLADYDLSFDVFRYGMIGYTTAQQLGKLNRKNLLTIIDFTKPSTQKRFYTLDLNGLKVIYHTYVSHGKNTGENEARSFSNIIHSNQSSLGFYLTAETYVGSKGYSLKLDGLEEVYNGNMRTRAVVMHEADYVSEYWIKKYGRLGRSQGCPALPVGLSKKVIDTIKEHTLIFAYFKDDSYLQRSAYLNIDQVIQNLSALASITKE